MTSIKNFDKKCLSDLDGNRETQLFDIISDEPLLTRQELAIRLAVSPRTIEGWHYLYRDMPSVRLGKRLLRYQYSKVIAWLQQKGA